MGLGADNWEQTIDIRLPKDTPFEEALGEGRVSWFVQGVKVLFGYRDFLNKALNEGKGSLGEETLQRCREVIEEVHKIGMLLQRGEISASRAKILIKDKEEDVMFCTSSFAYDLLEGTEIAQVP